MSLPPIAALDPGFSTDTRVGRTIRGSKRGPMEVPPDCERLDATDQIVAPGLVDLGAELREPGSEEDETIQSGSSAALAGGFTSVLCCANTSPVIDSPAATIRNRFPAALSGQA